jgi:type II secretory pathway pseudopilin PulG
MELLVVIGIVALMFALLMPVLSMVRRQADSTRATAQLASIETALNAYQSDFGDIPRFSRDDPNFPNPLNSAPDRGARLLARALFGPAPANDPRMSHTFTPADIPTYQNDSKSAFQDGHGTPDAPFGLKEHRQIIQRSGEAAAHYPGEVHEPYLDPEKFLLRRIGDVPEPPNPADRKPYDGSEDLLAAAPGFVYGVETVILDPLNNQPILYYPGLARQPNISDGSASLFVNETDQNVVQQSLYNAFDNRGYPDRAPPDAADPRRFHGLTPVDPDPATYRAFFSLCELLGDTNQNGRIDAGESAVTTAPYLLISGGVDGFQLNSDNPASPWWYVTTPIANFDVTDTD